MASYCINQCATGLRLSEHPSKSYATPTKVKHKVILTENQSSVLSVYTEWLATNWTPCSRGSDPLFQPLRAHNIRTHTQLHTQARS